MVREREKREDRREKIERGKSLSLCGRVREERGKIKELREERGER